MKGLRLIDRLSGQIWTANQEANLAGLVLLDSEQPVWLNGLQVEHTAYLVALPNGKIHLKDSQGDEIQLADWDSQLLPIKHERNSYLMFESRLRDLVKHGASFSDWLKVSPWVIQDIKDIERVLLNRFDRMLERHLWHLEEVSRRPQTRLTIEIERMPVGRARRIPPKAYPYLAAHTEDWEYRKLTSVVPSRILSTLPEELINFYENRLAARLITDCFRYLGDRLLELVAIENDLDKANPKQAGTHQRQQRIYRLMGEAIDLGVLQRRIHSTRIVLEKLRSRVMRLFESQLYKAITPQHRDQIPAEIRNTNILVNDRNYRFVNLLWKEYLEQNIRRPKTVQEIAKEQQNLCQGFHHFCAVLICHALHGLGFAENETSSLPHNRLSLASPWGTVELAWEADETITIGRNGNLLVRFVPIPSTLAANPHKVTHRLAEVRTAMRLTRKNSGKSPSRKKYPYTVILYPGQGTELSALDDETQAQLLTLGFDSSHSQEYGILPVSSYLLSSVERVGRSIRWSIWGSMFESYPPEISVPVRFETEILNKHTWLHSKGKHGVAHVLRLPEKVETSSLQEFLRQARSTLQSRSGKIHQLDLDNIAQCQQSLIEAERQLTELLTCPLCHQPANPDDFMLRENESFICICRDRDCRAAQWGLRICGVCGSKYPFLIQSGDGLSLPEHTHAGWLDDIFGMDVLSAPCPTTSNKWEFRCPHCGSCPKAQTSAICELCQVTKKDKKQ